MRKLILKMSLSADGFVGGPNGELDWLFRTTDDSVTEWTVNILNQAGVHIMGSRTFHDMAAYWPSSTEPFAAPMNEIPKVVFSRKGFIEPKNERQISAAVKDALQFNAGHRGEISPFADSWKDVPVASGDLEAEISCLKEKEGKFILAHGGASFARSLVEHRLIDEYMLLIHPVVLGKGLALFSSLKTPVFLRLESSTTFKSGAIGNIYVPAG